MTRTEQDLAVVPSVMFCGRFYEWSNFLVLNKSLLIEISNEQHFMSYIN